MNYEERIGQILIERGLKISTVESCTGGLLSSKLTDVSGSSNYITLNLVTYSNAAKSNILGVNKKILDEYGAVSEQCSYEMAQGLFKLTNSDICVSTTGIAGPTGGTDEKPVGLMYSTIFTPNNYRVYTILESSDIQRVEMKELFAKRVLKNIYEYLLQM
jgi:PncC family amidohydrolase